MHSCTGLQLANNLRRSHSYNYRTYRGIIFISPGNLHAAAVCCTAAAAARVSTDDAAGAGASILAMPLW